MDSARPPVSRTAGQPTVFTGINTTFATGFDKAESASGFTPSNSVGLSGGPPTGIELGLAAAGRRPHGERAHRSDAVHPTPPGAGHPA